MRRLRTALLATPLLALAILAPSAAGAPAITFSRCRRISRFSCGTLRVPLEHSNPALGTLRLHIARRLAGSSPSRDAVVALAGGPGQPALPLAGYLAGAIAPALHHRDLIVFDQRGTGRSDPLHCDALQQAPSGPNALGTTVRRCAAQIGAARSAYSTAESVQDIEAIRQAAGYEKLVLYGTSYGTRVALQYAETYPSHVEALVLDSVVPPQGAQPFGMSTFRAIRRVIAEICSHGACRQIASHPVAQIARLAARMRRHRLHGTVYDGSGHRHAASLGEMGLLDILLAGDLNPALRAMLPAAVHAALHRDAAPLLRLNLLSMGLVPTVPRRAHLHVPESVDAALFLDTTCEDGPFPWNPASPPATRLAEARSALRALPARAFYPFQRSAALGYGLTTACAHWPYSSTPATSGAQSPAAATRSTPPAAATRSTPPAAATRSTPPAAATRSTPPAAATPPKSPPLPPSASPPAPSAAPRALPDVPTLIFSGAQDLRTPTANARAVAAMIPDAKLLVVPYTGHSVLGSDLSGCAQAALATFFGGGEVQPCGPTPNLFGPTPAIPRHLAQVHRIAGVAGRAGRTLGAVLQTMLDLDRQVIGATLQADQALPSGSSFGGLRGGYARLTTKALHLRRLSFVGGVQLSATFPVRSGRLGAATVRVTGRAAAHGHVRLGGAGLLSGVLGGIRFSIEPANIHSAGAGRGPSRTAWPSAAAPGRTAWPSAALLPRRLLPRRHRARGRLRAIVP